MDRSYTATRYCPLTGANVGETKRELPLRCSPHGLCRFIGLPVRLGRIARNVLIVVAFWACSPALLFCTTAAARNERPSKSIYIVVKLTAVTKARQLPRDSSRGQASFCAADGKMPRYVSYQGSAGGIDLSGMIIVWNPKRCEFVGDIDVGSFSESVRLSLPGHIDFKIPLALGEITFHLLLLP